MQVWMFVCPAILSFALWMFSSRLKLQVKGGDDLPIPSPNSKVSNIFNDNEATYIILAATPRGL